jgi:hypothetical protein
MTINPYAHGAFVRSVHSTGAERVRHGWFTIKTVGEVCGRRPRFSGAAPLTFGSIARYTAPMPIQFVLPKKFTRAQIEWRVDELALQFQGTKDKKLIAQIVALNRVLAKMDALGSDVSHPKNRQ